VARPAAALLGALALAAAGCASGPKSLYAWGGYEKGLYDFARHPQDVERYAEVLGQAVARAEAERDRVPPGLYAEYGYALFTLGRLDDAVTYYAKERDAWPESVVLMEKLIRNTRTLRQQRPPSPRDGPAPPLPGSRLPGPPAPKGTSSGRAPP
jgi:hypothetical protein